MFKEGRILLDSLFISTLVVVAVPIALLISSYRRQSRAFRWLAHFFLLSLSVDLLSLTIYLSGYNQNYVNHLFHLFGVAFITPFFYGLIGWRSLKVPFIFLNVVYFLFAAVNVLFIQRIGDTNSYTQAFMSILMIMFCIIFFYKLLKELPTREIHRLPSFWIATGFFLSFSGKLVIYATSHYLVHYLGDRLEVVWIFHQVLSLIGLFLASIGIWINVSSARADSR